MPGCETKGDLDIAVRVSPQDFAEAERLISDAFARNDGSVRCSTFAAFIAEDEEIEVGIQLVVRDSKLDNFVRFRDLLLARPRLVTEFNVLKRAHEGADMDVYRAAKAAFVEAALADSRI